MRILVLDDMKLRHDAFDSIYESHEVRHAYTYTEFMFMLTDGAPWDVLHLDHDLGDEVVDCDTYVDGWGHRCEFNGQHAVLRVCELREDQMPKTAVIIHSINPSGAAAMKQLLTRRVSMLPAEVQFRVVWQPFDG